MPFFTFSPEVAGADASSKWDIVGLCISLATGGGRRSGNVVMMEVPGAAVAGIGDDRRLSTGTMVERGEIVGGGCVRAGI